MEGKVFGHCRLVRLLGKGGMGEVWLARHETLQKDVAVKFLPADFARNAEAVERFLREARSAARLEHPNVVQVLDAGSAGGVPFIVMQLVDGTDLEKVLKKKGRFDASDALSIGKKMAQALGAAHKLGIVHRDVKPSNVLLTKQGRVMVADFGLARDAGDATITTEGMVMGTPQYLAPEQARGEKVDARSDLYSLGCTLYHFLAGKPPYTGATPISVALKHASENDRPEPIGAAPEIEALVARLMAKKAGDRFQTAEELVAAIDRVKSGGGGGTATVRVTEDLVLTPRKRRKLLIAGAGAGLGLLLFTVILLALLGPNQAERSFRLAAQAKTAEEQVVRYRETAGRFPGSEWAKQAEAAIGVVFTAELKAARAGEGKASIAELVGRLDGVRKRFPEKAAAIDRAEDDLHRARVLARCEQLGTTLKSDRHEDRGQMRDLIQPEALKSIGQGGLRFWFNVALGTMLGPTGRFEQIDYAKDKLVLKRRETASVPVKVVLHRGQASERQTKNLVTEWVWAEGDWYLAEKGIREDK